MFYLGWKQGLRHLIWAPMIRPTFITLQIPSSPLRRMDRCCRGTEAHTVYSTVVQYTGQHSLAGFIHRHLCLQLYLRLHAGAANKHRRLCMQHAESASSAYSEHRQSNESGTEHASTVADPAQLYDSRPVTSCLPACEYSNTSDQRACEFGDRNSAAAPTAAA